MAPKKSTGDDGSPIGLTDGELRFIKAIFDNMTQKPDADWNAVAQALSLKDAKCAKERFRQMSVRHGWRGESSVASTPRKVAGDKVAKKPRTPRKPAAKKVIKKAEDDDDEDVKDEVKSEGKKVKSEEDYDDME